MSFITRIYLRAREEMAQSMTEYALIMAAVAVVAYAAYSSMGANLKSTIQSIGADL